MDGCADPSADPTCPDPLQAAARILQARLNALDGDLGAGPSPAAGCGSDDAELLARLDRWLPDLQVALSGLYRCPDLLPRLLGILAAAHRARPAGLRARDRARVLRPQWFQEPSVVGYVAYTERFAGTLAGVVDRIPYLRELGVTNLHLLPLLLSREGPDDGGYAVVDYTRVRPELGTMEDLAQLCRSLHEADMTLTLDLVLNHVAREHPWALAARRGEAYFRRFFLMFDDRELPDQYERSLPEVFPGFAPGNFTWDAEVQAHVWTTFHCWQWDLDWSNPDVFLAFTETIFELANRGVDCLRLDAVAFLWKRLGTDCQNQPEVHDIVQALRALAHIVAPSLAFKAEAIVGRAQVAEYLGTGRHAGRVSDLAYHNTLMAQVWSALATRDCRLLATALAALPPKPVSTAWATYLRCHDDIGWAVDDADAAALGWSGAAHRAFLSDFYTGSYPGSFARGQAFQSNPATGDRRVCGTAASLAGLEAALAAGREDLVELSIRRLLCAYAIILGFGGPALVYMGDELGLLNDYDFARQADHAGDNRWMHRPVMPWQLAEQRHDPTHISGRIFTGLRNMILARRSCESFHASVETEFQATSNQAVLLGLRRHAAGRLVLVFNVSEHEQAVPPEVASATGPGPWWDHLGRRGRDVAPGRLAPYAAWWLGPPGD